MLDTSAVAGLGTGPAPVLISVVRNERVRLPRLIDHYRAMGIAEFVFVDNGSTDGTSEFLAAQADVTLLRTTDGFADANYGMDWINAVRAALPAECWALFVDADEYLVYEGWPGRSIVDYLATVPADRNAIVGFMLDMYPAGDLKEADPSGDLLATARFFDADYHFRRRPRKPWVKSRANIEIVGGPRVRLFSTLARERRSGWIAYFVRGQLDRILPAVPAAWRTRVIENFPATLPALKKTPLLRGRETEYGNNHDARGARYHAVNCVLLHYKFTAEFAEKIEREAGRQEHYRFGAEYILYRKYFVRRKRAITLFQPGLSAEFRTADDLLQAGLIRDVTAYFD